MVEKKDILSLVTLTFVIIALIFAILTIFAINGIQDGINLYAPLFTLVLIWYFINVVPAI